MGGIVLLGVCEHFHLKTIEDGYLNLEECSLGPGAQLLGASGHAFHAFRTFKDHLGFIEVPK